jgi:hypothetical protein
VGRAGEDIRDDEAFASAMLAGSAGRELVLLLLVLLLPTATTATCHPP